MGWRCAGCEPGQGVRYVAADISQAMLERTMAAGHAPRRSPRRSSRCSLTSASCRSPDAEFDLVVSFTGLHCFPDPHQAVREMGRVLHPGGVLTGSALLNDTGVRYGPMRQIGRFAGLLGPAATSTEVERWLTETGFDDISITLSGRSGTSARSRGEAGRRDGRAASSPTSSVAC